MHHYKLAQALGSGCFLRFQRRLRLCSWCSSFRCRLLGLLRVQQSSKRACIGNPRRLIPNSFWATTQPMTRISFRKFRLDHWGVRRRDYNVAYRTVHLRNRHARMAEGRMEVLTCILLEGTLQLASGGLAQDVDLEERLISNGKDRHSGLDHQWLQESLPHVQHHHKCGTLHSCDYLAIIASVMAIVKIACCHAMNAVRHSSARVQPREM